MDYPMCKVFEYKSKMLANTMLVKFLNTPDGCMKLFPLNDVKQYFTDLWLYCIQRRVALPLPEVKAEHLIFVLDNESTTKVLLWNALMAKIKNMPLQQSIALKNDFNMSQHLHLTPVEWETFKQLDHTSITKRVLIKLMAQLDIPVV